MAAVDDKLLKRFPRFRGYVSKDEREWVIPEHVDAHDYVEVVELTCGDDHGVDAAVLSHVEKMMSKDLPEQRSWQAQLLRFTGREHCFIVWRIAHTVADGVVLTQLMSNVLCEPLDAKDAADASASAPPPTKVRTPPRLAGPLERLWRFVAGIAFVIALPFWPADTRTALQLGPARWARRQRASMTNLAEAGTRPAIKCAMMKPLEVSELKAAAKAASVTINDLLMSGIAGGIRAYLIKCSEPAPPNLRLSAVAVINPRPIMPQTGLGGSEALLDAYASMKGPGCDITLGILPLPCGDLPPVSRLRAIAASTRALKLSPETLLLRLGATLITRLFGLRALVALYTHIIAKFTTYVSNVVAPPIPGAICGIRIRRIFFGTAPLDFGVSFSFLSYASQTTLFCTADAETVPSAQLMADCVREHIVAQMHASTARSSTDVTLTSHGAAPPTAATASIASTDAATASPATSTTAAIPDQAKALC